jgi:hypothetical protein
VETRTSHWQLDRDLTFETPLGQPLVARGSDLALEYASGVLTEARLTFLVPLPGYTRISEEGLFHLAVENRGPGGATFSPDGEVQVEARLEPALLSGIAVLGTDIAIIGPRFEASFANGPLSQSESWYALSVTEEVLRDAEGGSLRQGYSTLFAAPPGPLRLPILDVAAGVFDERGWDWNETSDSEVMHVEVSGDNGSWACYILARDGDGRCTIYSQAPWQTPSHQRAAMAELLARVNFGLPLGNFELDMEDGEVRFKTSINLGGERLSVALFEALLDPNIATMDSYLPALEAVRDGRLSPEAAVRQVEG